MVALDMARDEAELVKQAKAGGREAFGELYMMHLDAIYRYIYFRIGNTHDSEDLAEQVFLKAWEALPGYKDFGHPFTSWLYRIAHNLIIDYHRRSKTAPSEDLEEANEPEDIQPHGILNQIIDGEEVSSLVSAIVCLPEEQQQVIILRFVEGMNHSEVARILNKSEGACRMIQNRALIALNQILTSPRGTTL